MKVTIEVQVHPDPLFVANHASIVKHIERAVQAQLYPRVQHTADGETFIIDRILVSTLDAQE